jgi:hypothetical protein
MKVIIKNLANQFGHIDQCHIAEFGQLNLKFGAGTLRIQSYASKSDFEAGMQTTMSRDIQVKFSEIGGDTADYPAGTPVFEALWLRLATKLITDADSPFKDGSIEDAVSPVN